MAKSVCPNCQRALQGLQTGFYCASCETVWTDEEVLGPSKQTGIHQRGKEHQIAWHKIRLDPVLKQTDFLEDED